MGLPRRGWFLLARSIWRAEVAAGRLPEFALMTYRRRNGEWSWENSEGCRPRAHRDGLAAVTWRWDRSQEPPNADATSVSVLVRDEECNSGRDATGRVLAPWVHYGKDAITVTYFVRPPTGTQTCQGSPPTKVELSLDEPIGDRTLRDGSELTPKDRWPVADAP